MKINRDIQRLFDLVRYCRAELHKDRLITDEEYADLLTSRGSVERLHKYDRIIADRNKAQKEVRYLKDQLYLIWQESWKDHGMSAPAFDEKVVSHIAIDAMRSPVIERDKYRDQLCGMLCECGTSSGEEVIGVCTVGRSNSKGGECLEPNCPYWKESDAT